MNKFKKVVAALLTLTMVFSLTMVASGTEIPGEGDVIYVPVPTAVSVVLPTAGSFDFTLDPQGVYGLEDGDSILLSDAVGGQVIPANLEGGRIVNNSAFPVTVTAEFLVTGDANVVSTAAAVTTGDTPNLLLYVVPSANNTGEVFCEDEYVDTPFVSSLRGFAVPAEETGHDDEDEPLELVFVLGAAEFEIVRDGNDFNAERVRGTSPSTSILIGGAVNPYANWYDFVRDTSPLEVGLFTVFEVARATDPEIAEDAIHESFALISAYNLLVQNPPVPPEAAVPLTLIPVGPADPTAGFFVNNEIVLETSVRSAGAWTSVPIRGFVDADIDEVLWDGDPWATWSDFMGVAPAENLLWLQFAMAAELTIVLDCGTELVLNFTP